MDFLFSSLVATSLQILVTGTTIFALYSGYTKGKLYFQLAITPIILDTIYLVFFLISRYSSGHITEDFAEEVSYAYLAPLHGIISIVAIIYTFIFFIKAKKAYLADENYFKAHPKQSILIGLLWIVSLISGVVL